MALKRFWPDAPRQKRARTEELDQAVSNDSGPPAATHSELSAGLRRWCERGAWGACPEMRHSTSAAEPPAGYHTEKHAAADRGQVPLQALL